MTSELGFVVWHAVHDPFGKATVDEDVDNDGKTIEMNVRFPGQYYDAESGLHYNYFRTYDPALGRYITSDPIGLLGGVNTFGYVFGNPIRLYDESGLYLSTADNIRISSAVGISVVVFRRNPNPIFSGLAGAFAAGLAASYSNTATRADIVNSILNGFITGVNGSLIGDLMKIVSKNNFNAAVNTGLLSGSVDLLLNNVKQPFEDDFFDQARECRR